ncbi:DNA-protecting protein DprA [Providencia rettgeri]|uniref:DNA-processing protein DprA n=2 Tax=Providencia TaxID=586 RepID=A0AA42FPI2_9GAMM|nr:MULTISPECIES: DNA-processing protein DprA [Providencia]EIL1982163.1 DNA-protecting protein DprA [Providencia rettgeri]EIU9515214.1 DNA-protecting protein DprA [Providencia rettgeri]EJD6368543.1 DNA-protecting protein DprA [Providencia rettgeri]EJD6373528.1 DNA-protecting protein DprA [Providencia rettgeri]EJD6412080.1 DNA-protecting protein DprA [Providencia rettgeri]
MNTQEIWLRMSQVKKLLPQRAVKIVNELTLLDKVSHQALRDSGLNEMQQLQFLHVPMNRIEKVQKWLANQNHQLITYLDPNYPHLLKQIYRPPLLLFVVGQSELLATPQVALIGSRQASEYGRKWTNIFTKDFVQHGVTITSGLAIGIDGISHKAALDNDGKTIAVLGSGLENIYPKQHYGLAEHIKMNGALISEYWPSTPPLPKQFPQRNRIISGLSKAVVVIEAGMKSGSLITARYAIEQNRDLFTLPAPLGNPAFGGNHWLLQQGAYLLIEPNDVLQHLVDGLNWIQTELPINENPLEFNVVENKILGMVGYKPTPVDVIAEQTQVPITQVISILTEMEINGVICSSAGGYIRLT